jgi:hypothetical protein
VHRRGIAVRLGCDEACTATVRVTLRVRMASAAIRFATVRRRVAAGRSVTVRVRPTRRSRRALARALRRGARPVARVRITTRDLAGNQAPARTHRVRLTR